MTVFLKKHENSHYKHTEMHPFCSTAHAHSKAALIWQCCTHPNTQLE